MGCTRTDEVRRLQELRADYKRPDLLDRFQQHTHYGFDGNRAALIVALFVAVMLNSALNRFKNTFRILYFMPNITSIVAVTLVFSTMFGNNGMVNWLLNTFGAESVPFNSGWWGVKIAISSMVMWRWMGYNAIIFLSGLQSIPTDIYEAAKIDGATRGQLLYHAAASSAIHSVRYLGIDDRALQLFTEPYVFLGQSGTALRGRKGSRWSLTCIMKHLRTDFSVQRGNGGALFIATILFSVLNMMVGREGKDTGGKSMSTVAISRKTG